MNTGAMIQIEYVVRGIETAMRRAVVAMAEWIASA